MDDHPDPLTGLLDRALEDIADRQLLHRLGRGHLAVAIALMGAGVDHEQTRELNQQGLDAEAEPVGDILVLPVRGQVAKRHDRHRGPPGKRR